MISTVVRVHYIWISTLVVVDFSVLLVHGVNNHTLKSCGPITVSSTVWLFGSFPNLTEVQLANECLCLTWAGGSS